ncbi:hypothetical protein D9757_015302 [Collybiopsis confluens]|uniref:Uncharacterized protein n=1 Tax=Collybiopsis confluens TaxID=2823264 RepID=A0A8H5FNA8_9AGAR|nr:hypothetical protein D9757_015302 [Collybiopsis confluens]
MPGREVFPLANEAIVLRPFDENAPTQQWLFVPSKGSDSGPYRILNAATENTSSRRFLGFITRNWDPIFFPPRLIEPDRADVCGLVDSDMPQTWKLDSTEQDPSRTDCVTGQSSSSFTCASIKCISPYDMYPILLGTVLTGIFTQICFPVVPRLHRGKWNVFMASRDPEISPDGWYYLRNVGTSRYLSVSVAQFKLREPRFNLDPDGAAAAFQVKYAGGSTEVRLALLPSSYLTEVGGTFPCQ